MNDLQYANEYTLRYRIKAAVEGLGNNLIRFISLFPDRYADIIVDTRNSLTHPAPESQKRVLRVDEYECEIRRLRLLMTILLFKEIGFTESRIVSIFEDNFAVQRVFQGCRQPWT